MKKKEFREAIQRARESRHIRHSVCAALLSCFNDSGAVHIFSSVFRPRNICGTAQEGIDNGYYFWLGDMSPENTELRHHFLDAFEAYCLSSLSDYVYKRFY
jgi:hypothetical protein